MKGFNVAPFALPNCPENEVWFEQSRDIRRILASFAGAAPKKVKLFYLQKTWPQVRFELPRDQDLHDPCMFGWKQMDDWFNGKWQEAAVETELVSRRLAAITFKGLRAELKEFPGREEYDVTFRRTLGIRLEANGSAAIKKIEVFTDSHPALSRVRVELDAGRRTPGKWLRLSGYNAAVREITPQTSVSVRGLEVKLRAAKKRIFHFEVSHMLPAHRYSNDNGHVTFTSDREAFTISLAALKEQGPIWFADQGVYLTRADDPTSFADYKARIKGCKTIRQQVLEMPEQSLAGAYHGQPRPHAVAYSIGCKHARQRFWLEPNGDVVLTGTGFLRSVPGKDTLRYKGDGDGRFFFGLERWPVRGRFTDPAPILAYNIHMQRDDILVEQKSFAVPLLRSILDGELAGDDPVVALVRFRFQNTGDRPAVAELPIEYSPNSSRSFNRRTAWVKQDDYQVPASPQDPLSAEAGRITSQWHGQSVLRCTYSSIMEAAQSGGGIMLTKPLQPGESCEAVLKVPFIALDSPEELAALDTLDFERCYKELKKFWREECRHGAQIMTPLPHLNALYASHLAHVQITDFAMPDNSRLVNTSVGTSTYGNFSNESCMIIQELDERGLPDEARRRLEVWLKYQSTVGLLGNFTDHDGVFFGAGGFESGQTYDQHHGWVLWRLSEHFFMTRDDEWLRGIADRLIAGANWVFRQRRHTMAELPHSRGWEQGFLPAGSLEDVADYFYWLSTNAMTWRGTNSVACALECIGHPEAARIRKESDAYRHDLIRGFETMRRHAPLVRLRDGRWVPHYPSRLYCRGRDYGWIRETLEGSVYLLLGTLYDADSKQAQWILDDYLDNRYMNPPFGYVVTNPEKEWFDRGGFSIQPNLLAGLMPHLDRDEIEVYTWMFFNAWAACYREEIGAMVEHPYPVLGFSNSAHFKTSDQSNAVKWLRYMFVYAPGEVLHLGRGIPRAWLADGKEIWAEKVATRFGQVSVRYSSEAAAGLIRASANLSLEKRPTKILVRIRHPEKRPIQSVTVDGLHHRQFDAARGDVDITGHCGRIAIEAHY